MTKKKGILFIINDLNPGGAEIFVLRLAKFLSDYFSIYIFCLNPEKNDASIIQLFEKNLDFEFLNTNAPLNKLQEKIYWKINALATRFGKKGLYTHFLKKHHKKKLKQQLKKLDVVAIISSGFSSDAKSISYFKKQFKLPVIITMHSSYNPENWVKYFNDESKFLKEAFETLNHSDATFYTAERNLEIFKKFKNYSGPVPQKIYLGFEPETKCDLREQYHINEDAFVTCMMARGIAEKGWKEAIDGFLKFNGAYPNSYFFIISTLTGYMEELKEIYSKEKSLIFTGFQAKPAPFLYSSDCSILSTYYPESLPYAITESLACGVPVLATPVAEIPNMLTTTEGIAGEIIPFNEQKKADSQILADNLYRLATDKIYLDSKKKLAYKAFEKFSMNTCGHNYLQLIKKITHSS